jgi:hypothetical protein
VIAGRSALVHGRSSLVVRRWRLIVGVLPTWDCHSEPREESALGWRRHRTDSSRLKPVRNDNSLCEKPIGVASGFRAQASGFRRWLLASGVSRGSSFRLEHPSLLVHPHIPRNRSGLIVSERLACEFEGKFDLAVMVTLMPDFMCWSMRIG